MESVHLLTIESVSQRGYNKEKSIEIKLLKSEKDVLNFIVSLTEISARKIVLIKRYFEDGTCEEVSPIFSLNENKFKLVLKNQL